jgi:hypothetical protein
MIVQLIFIFQNLLLCLLIKEFQLSLINCLVDRRHFPKDWNQRSVAIRAKIAQSIVRYACEHDETS